MASLIIESIRTYSNEYLPTIPVVGKAYKYLWQPVLLLLAPQLTTNVVMPNCTAGREPIMGWSSWKFGHGSDKVVSAAKALKLTGLWDVGYRYLNMDDGWQQKQRDAKHRLVPLNEFIGGMNNLSTIVHSLDCKLGIYSTGTYETCGGNAGSLCNEDLDAATFAQWGIDLLKYDNCHIPTKKDQQLDYCSNPTKQIDWTDKYYYCIPDRYTKHPVINGTCMNITNPAPPKYKWVNSNTAERYNRMRDALKKQYPLGNQTENGEILFSMCIWGMADVYEWGNDTGISWRVSRDMLPSWSRLTEIVNIMSFRTNSTNFCGHNDADVLQVGHTITDNKTHKTQALSEVEERTHFAMWAAMKSPLVLDTNIAELKPTQLDLLKNKYLIQFNQDKIYGGSANPYKWGRNRPDPTFDPDYPAEYWAGPSQHGTLVLMMNTGNKTEFREVEWKEINPSLKHSPGLSGTNKYRYVNVFNETDTGCTEGSYIAEEVKAHDTAAILIYATC